MTSAAVIYALLEERQRLFSVISSGDGDLDQHIMLDWLDNEILVLVAENRGVVLSEDSYGALVN